MKKNTKQGQEWLKKAAKKGSTLAAKMQECLEPTVRYKVLDTRSPGQSEALVVDPKNGSYPVISTIGGGSSPAMAARLSNK